MKEGEPVSLTGADLGVAMGTTIDDFGRAMQEVAVSLAEAAKAQIGQTDDSTPEGLAKRVHIAGSGLFGLALAVDLFREVLFAEEQIALERAKGGRVQSE